MLARRWILVAGFLFACGDEKPDDLTRGEIPIPELLAVSPASPANNNTPFLSGRADTGLLVRIYGDALCEDVRGIGTADAFTTTGIPIVVTDDTTSTFYARAERSDAALSRCSSTSITYVEDSTPPATPTLTHTTPTSPANDNAPRVFGSADAESLIEIFDNDLCAGTALGSGMSEALSGDGITLTLPDNRALALYASASDAVGNRSSCTATALSYVEDSQGPAFAGLYEAAYNGTDITVTWSQAVDNFASGDAITYEICRSQTAGGCATWETFETLTGTTYFIDSNVTVDEIYYYRVRAKDPVGNLTFSTREDSAYMGCATGYLLTANGCEWQHGFANHELDEVGGWTTNGVTLDSHEPIVCAGASRTGTAIIDYAATCAGQDALAQTITMPERDKSEAFALAVSYYEDLRTPCEDHCTAYNEEQCHNDYNRCIWNGSTCANSCSQYDADACEAWGCAWDNESDTCGIGYCLAPYLGVRLGPKRFEFYPYDASDSCDGYHQACLGDAFHGRTLEARVGATDTSICGFNGSTDFVRPARLDFVRIEPRAGCPNPGELIDGSFDAETSTYTYYDGTRQNVGPSLGEDGSAGFQCDLATRCGQCFGSKLFSIPSALSSPAIEVWHDTDADVSLVLSSQSLGEGHVLAGTGAPRTTRFCLPDAERGLSSGFNFRFAGPGNSLSSPQSNCSDAFPRTAKLDSVKLVSDNRCGTGNVIDGSFELAVTAPDLLAWHNQLYRSGGGYIVAEIRTGNVGRGGSASAGHVVLDACGSSSIRTYVSVPLPVGGSGPAVRFHYKLIKSASGNSNVILPGNGYGSSLQPAAEWTASEINCISTTYAGMSGILGLGLQRFSACNVEEHNELWVDDVEVFVDPSCPAE